MRKLIAVASIAAFSLSLAACKSEQPTEQDAVDAGAEQADAMGDTTAPQASATETATAPTDAAIKAQ